MKKYLLLVGLVLMLATVSACLTRDSSEIEGSVTIPNSLGFGGMDDGVLVQFLRVENDSRCAEGVQCVRAGEAFVVLSTTVDGGTPVESRLEMTPGGENSFDIDRFEVTLLELRPDPPPVGGVEQNQYELILRIKES